MKRGRPPVPKICECGRPSKSDKGGGSNGWACERCIELDNWHPYADVVRRSPNTTNAPAFDPSPGNIPQIDSRRLCDGLAYYVRKLDRLPAWTKI